jgi:hypothetical protein
MARRRCAGAVDPQQFAAACSVFLNSGMYEFDSRFVYVDIRDAEKMFDFEPSCAAEPEDRRLYHAESVDHRIQEFFR